MKKKNKKLWQQMHGTKKAHKWDSEESKTYPRPVDRDERKKAHERSKGKQGETRRPQLGRAKAKKPIASKGVDPLDP